MIYDGYGDASPEQLVEQVEPLICYFAAQYASRTSLIYHDLVQEGLVHYWNTLHNHPGQKLAYYQRAAKSRMLNVALRGDPMVGSTGGNHYRPDTVGVDWVESAFLAPAAADLLGAVEWAYHRGQIAQALEAFSAADREFVFARFWLGKTNEEITAERGLPYGYLARRWSRAIAPKLRASLADLHQAVAA